eukprot:Phypoly_transcript_02957.p1 GENE.Phypoly_transcript_02957~~Phypoly_transcript_02957.p1  ORF type:complete len:727 (+),score=65.03 Phypoly_transcript_02957:324-2504(+)
MMVDAGFNIARTDLYWGIVEHQAGHYDFSTYDPLMQQFDENSITPMLILDYGNGIYDDGNLPYSEEARIAMAYYAGNVTQHYAGKNYIYEMWNEPNADTSITGARFAALSNTVGSHLRQTMPNVNFIGPGLARIPGSDLQFLEDCMKEGTLEYWDAVSFHPYQTVQPEDTEGSMVSQVRELIARHKPENKRSIGLIMSELGYTTAGPPSVDQYHQDIYLPRLLLYCVASEIPISIWYEWRDEAVSNELPDNFGSVFYSYTGTIPPFVPKNGYIARRILNNVLGQMTFNKRLVQSTTTAWLLLFTSGESEAFAAWTTSGSASETVRIPSSPGATFTIYSYLGATSPASADSSGYLTLPVSDAPQYVVPTSSNDVVAIMAATSNLPMKMRLPFGENHVVLTVLNVLSRTTTISLNGVSATLDPGYTAQFTADYFVYRDAAQQDGSFCFTMESTSTYCIQTVVVSDSPIIVQAYPMYSPNAQISVTPYNYQVTLSGTVNMKYTSANGETPNSQSVSLSPSVPSQTFSFHVSNFAPISVSYLSAELADSSGNTIVKFNYGFMLSDDLSQYSVGSSPSSWSLSLGTGATGSLTVANPSSSFNANCIQFSFNLPASHTVSTITHIGQITIPDGATSAGVWVWTDGTISQVDLRTQLIDSTGQTLQYNYYNDYIPTVSGWQYFLANFSHLDDHWGGANDGLWHSPVHWGTLFLFDSFQGHQNSIYFSAPAIIV